MKRVWKQLKARRAEIASHPFFAWLNASTVPLEQRFLFTPVMIDFIMGFADMNKWFLSYPNPQDELEHGINQHTEEDRTHSRLFHENWYTLDLEETFSWPPGKVLWWMFESSDSAIVRRFGMEVLDLAVIYPDPRIRFVMMEAIEICGDVFFANTAPIATILSRKHGVEHDYYGQYHRDRETGHLHTNEAAFNRATLSDEQRVAAESAANRIFDCFHSLLTQLLSYSERAVTDQRKLQRELEDEYQLALSPPRRTARQPARSEDGPVHESQRSLVAHLTERKQRLSTHALLDWLRTEDAMPAVQRLQRFVALWGIDIVGYKDFNELVLRYDEPKSAAEKAINRWTAELATHNVLFLQDWKSLRMDRVLHWNMGETVAFYFLGDETEVHRCNMAKVKHHAFAHKQPQLRFWLMKALEASGEPFFACTQPIAETIEAELGVTLNYFANRHDLAHPSGETNQEDFSFLSSSLTDEEVRVAHTMIDTVFDNMEENFTLSLRIALSGVFSRNAASLPPPRQSEIRLRANVLLPEGEGESDSGVSRALARRAS